MKFPVFILSVTLLTSCSRPQNDAKSADSGSEDEISNSSIANSHTYLAQISPTPIDNAEERYSEFRYHYRLAGSKDFISIKPASVERTKDGSVEAKFKVTVQNPIPDKVYESYYSYFLDGKEVEETVECSPLISTKKAEQGAAANP